MADEPNTTPSTTPADPAQAMGNDPTARNPDGSLKDNQAAPSTETKPESSDDSKKSEPSTKTEPAKTEPAKTDAKSDAKAPTYTEFKAPNGVTLDKAAIEAAIPVFQELGLTQDQAQKLVEVQAAREAAVRGEGSKAYEDLRAQWRDSVVKDPALGDGKGDLKPEVKADIGRAIDSLPADQAKEFREAMILTGAGDNPAFVKAFYTLSSLLGEGTLVKGGGPSPAGQASPNGPKSAAQALFPNLPSSSR